ncbi:MAG: deoxyguanosinetriphosphate triphosphohydrolase [Clostridia bacterium]|nr:deoxyguanosinetriphosphate triphosphohydrolase [Clostridia bacterium]
MRKIKGTLMINKTHKIEEMFLSPYATKSKDTKGRAIPEEPSPTRTEFQRDRDRIIHCKAFRRLKNKTQVFLKPEGDHFRTRLTHTLDVAQIGRTIARICDLNEDLTEAIALGHDLGHTPFGHAGERALAELTHGEFSHNKQSLRVVEILEHNGKGLNLTFEVKDGILNHNSKGNPKTLEGMAVHLADRIAYLNHDIDDSIRAGIITEEDVPKDVREVLGNNFSMRINTMIESVYKQSAGKNTVAFEDHVLKATLKLREFMFERVYFSEGKKKEEYKVDLMIKYLFDWYVNNPKDLPDLYKQLLKDYSLETVVADYISTMTDTYALDTFKILFEPCYNITSIY